MLLLGIPSAIVAGILSPALIPCLLGITCAAVVWAVICQVVFSRAGHAFIRGNSMPLGRFVLVMVRFVHWQVMQLLHAVGVLAKRIVEAQTHRVRSHAQARGVAKLPKPLTRACSRAAADDGRNAGRRHADRAVEGKGIHRCRIAQFVDHALVVGIDDDAALLEDQAVGREQGGQLVETTIASQSRNDVGRPSIACPGTKPAGRA